MYNISLNEQVIQAVEKRNSSLNNRGYGSDVVKIILYGSCARGDYTEDSDIDIALLLKSDRLKQKKYGSVLANIATELAMKYFAVVNFVCLPYEEYIDKNDWYDYFRNIKQEGRVLYG